MNTELYPVATLTVPAGTVFTPYQRAWGVISDDKATHGNHPFPDGTPVLTSAVIEVFATPEGSWLVTANSCYRIEFSEGRDG